MEEAVEAAAKVNYENWGGPWATAPEFRRVQSRAEVVRIFKALEANGFQITRKEAQ